MRKWTVQLAKLGVGFGALLFAATMAVVIAFSGRDPEGFAMDVCLDQGGCWDSLEHVCRKVEPNAQELCWRSRGGAKSAGPAVGHGRRTSAGP